MTEIKSSVPSFTGIRNKLFVNYFHPTIKESCIHISSTERDSIFTPMVNFQDVLKQQGQNYGSLWCDEGVYLLAKEIQSLQTEIFSNLLRLGGFHFGKIIYGCIGSYLDTFGISSVLVSAECFGTKVFNSVMAGTNYIRSEGISRVHQSIFSFILEDFFLNTGNEVDVEMIADLINKEFPSWERCKARLQSDFDIFPKERYEANANFKYWFNFLLIFTQLYVILLSR